MTMDENKRFYTMEDVMKTAVEGARAESLYEVNSKICDLENAQVNCFCKDDELYRGDFEVVGDVSYGTEETILGSIYFQGNWTADEDFPLRNRLCSYRLMTHKLTKESYLAMGMLVNLICYYANEFVNKHPERFD